MARENNAQSIVSGVAAVSASDHHVSSSSERWEIPVEPHIWKIIHSLESGRGEDSSDGLHSSKTGGADCNDLYDDLTSFQFRSGNCGGLGRLRAFPHHSSKRSTSKDAHGNGRGRSYRDSAMAARHAAASSQAAAVRLKQWVKQIRQRFQKAGCEPTTSMAIPKIPSRQSRERLGLVDSRRRESTNRASLSSDMEDRYQPSEQGESVQGDPRDGSHDNAEAKHDGRSQNPEPASHGPIQAEHHSPWETLSQPNSYSISYPPPVALSPLSTLSCASKMSAMDIKSAFLHPTTDLQMHTNTITSDSDSGQFCSSFFSNELDDIAHFLQRVDDTYDTALASSSSIHTSNCSSSPIESCSFADEQVNHHHRQLASTSCSQNSIETSSNGNSKDYANELPDDPRLWTSEHVRRWLNLAKMFYGSTSDLDNSQVSLNGVAMCFLAEEGFLWRWPICGQQLFQDFQRRLRHALSAEGILGNMLWS